MSSPPLPSAPLADRLAWLAGEVRSEKAEVGVIVAAFMEVFARLLARLAGFAARAEAGAPPRPEPRATTTPTFAAASGAPGLLPRVFGWFGGLLPAGGPVAPIGDRATASAIRAVAVPPAGKASIRGTSPRLTVLNDMSAPMPVAASSLGAPAWVGALLATWRRLPAATAGPFFSNREFRRWPMHVHFVTISQLSELLPLPLREGLGEGSIRQEVYRRYFPSEEPLPHPLPQGEGGRRQPAGCAGVARPIAFVSRAIHEDSHAPA